MAVALCQVFANGVSAQSRYVRCLAQVGMSALLPRPSAPPLERLPPGMIRRWTPRRSLVLGQRPPGEPTSWEALHPSLGLRAARQDQLDAQLLQSPAELRQTVGVAFAFVLVLENAVAVGVPGHGSAVALQPAAQQAASLRTPPGRSTTSRRHHRVELGRSRIIVGADSPTLPANRVPDSGPPVAAAASASATLSQAVWRRARERPGPLLRVAP